MPFLLHESNFLFELIFQLRIKGLAKQENGLEKFFEVGLCVNELNQFGRSVLDFFLNFLMIVDVYFFDLFAEDFHFIQ